MIPKIIHYCWFGKNPLPSFAKKCINSWKQYCPDYQIIEWNEDTFDISSSPKYVKEAFNEKKWAFVTDYVRLYVLIEYGGIYMDTDVELIKPLAPFLSNMAFSGFENDTCIPTGIMASEKNHPLFKELLKYYDTASFINSDGSLNLTTNVTIITQELMKLGFIPNGEFQVVNDFTLYPKDFFCPIEYYTFKMNKTKNTVAIHWFSGSWKTDDQKKARDAQLKRERLDWAVHIPHRLGKRIMGENVYNKIKKIVKR